MWKIYDMGLVAALVLCLAGCTKEALTNTPSPEVSARASDLSALLTSTKTVVSTQTTILTAIQANTAAIGEVKTKIESLEASLVKSETATGTEVIKSAPDPAQKSPAAQMNSKASSEQDLPLETLVQLATRLYARGVNTHMKTREQLEAIDAQLKAGQPVTGAMFPNNRASAVTSQRSAVRFVPRGRSRFWGQSNSAGKTCGSNGCY